MIEFLDILSCLDDNIDASTLDVDDVELQPYESAYWNPSPVHSDGAGFRGSRFDDVFDEFTHFDPEFGESSSDDAQAFTVPYEVDAQFDPAGLSPEEMRYQEWLASAGECGVPAEVVHTSGTFVADASYWRLQEGDMSCAVATSLSILESITGEVVPESQLTEQLIAEGRFCPFAGTKVDALHVALERSPGVEVTNAVDTQWSELSLRLEMGDKVIAAVDAN